MQKSSLYLNHLYRQVAVEYTCEFIQDLPAEIGRLHVQRKSTRQGIHYLDWNMCYHNDVFVNRKGALEQEEIQIIFFVNRGMDWNVDGQQRPVQMEKGDMSIYWNHNMTTSACYPGQCEFEFRSIQIPCRYFWDTLEEHLEDGQRRKLERALRQEVARAVSTPQMWRLLGEIKQLEPYGGGLMSLQLEGKVLELMALCLNEIMEPGRGYSAGRSQLSRTDQDTIREAKRIINLQPAAVPGCRDLAKQLNISTSKLTRGFLELYGTTMHAYVVERRLEQAAALLGEGRCNVSQAAILSGYSNLSHFSSSFKKKYGILPKDYK
ncbi:MAG: helix-turn-helix transcriptional regulator [Lachnospiraceae bacterium]